VRVVFDIEANGLLDNVSEVHCLVTQETDKNEVKSYNNVNPNRS
jgi:hypothetical protein